MRPTGIMIDVTTRCDRRCPDCCLGIGINRVLQDHPWEYFEHAAQFFYGCERVHLIGGEPTFHRQFAEFLPKFKQLFGCKRLTMVTDGWGVERYKDLIDKHLDMVIYSEYHLRPNALEALTRIAPILIVEEWGQNASGHVPRSRIGGGKPCDRAYGDISHYADGKLYPCSVSVGVGGIGMEPTMDWQDRIQEVPLPCSTCFLSVS